MDNFADAPKSITEIRADQAQSGQRWTPRDALIALLREIDSGATAPTDLIVTYIAPDETGTPSAGQVLAYKNKLAILGALVKGVNWVSGVSD